MSETPTEAFAKETARLLERLSAAQGRSNELERRHLEVASTLALANHAKAEAEAWLREALSARDAARGEADAARLAASRVPRLDQDLRLLADEHSALREAHELLKATEGEAQRKLNAYVEEAEASYSELRAIALDRETEIKTLKETLEAERGEFGRRVVELCAEIEELREVIDRPEKLRAQLRDIHAELGVLTV